MKFNTQLIHGGNSEDPTLVLSQHRFTVHQHSINTFLAVNLNGNILEQEIQHVHLLKN